MKNTIKSLKILIADYESAVSRAFGVVHNQKPNNFNIYDYNVDDKGILEYVLYCATYTSQKYLTKLTREHGHLITEIVENNNNYSIIE